MIIYPVSAEGQIEVLKKRDHKTRDLFTGLKIRSGVNLLIILLNLLNYCRKHSAYPFEM